MKVRLILSLLYITSIYSVKSQSLLELLKNAVGEILGQPMEPELGMTVLEVIEYHGYPVEIHHPVTKDGYILTLHRIPNGKIVNDSLERRPPVLIQHGILCSSIVFVWNPPAENLAYFLADKGFDVWLGNIRGNEYTLNNTNFTSDSKQFWDFSWDEMAKYDVPSSIDYILSDTNNSKLWYIGHSMGTTIGFAMLSSKPEYNEKVNIFTALAPVVYVENMKSPLGLVSPFSKILAPILAEMGNGKLDLNDKMTAALLTQACAIQPLSLLVCTSVAFALFGPDYAQLNQSRLNYYLSVYPTSTSTRTFTQYGLNKQAKKFNYYDFGPQKNLIKYNQTTPPEYNVSKITVPVAMIWAENDWLADPRDIATLRPKLQNLVSDRKVNFTQFSHSDYIWGIDAVQLVYTYALEDARKYQ